MTSPLFLKLGGSLITDKTRPYQPHLDRLTALAGQLAAVLKGLRNNDWIRQQINRAHKQLTEFENTNNSEP